MRKEQKKVDKKWAKRIECRKRFWSKEQIKEEKKTEKSDDRKQYIKYEKK